MGRKKKDFQVEIFENLEIIDIAEEGKGVAKHNELVVFVERAIPGDIVDARIYKKKKNFAEAAIHHLKKTSEHRVEPFCSHFGVCGGCKWQHMTYDAQLKFKSNSVASALQRLAKVDVSDMLPILGSEKTTYYRNKLEFTFSNKRWLESPDQMDEQVDMNALGFHVPGRFDKILDIKYCYLQDEPSNIIRNSIREYALEHDMSFYDLRNHTGALRNVIIRKTIINELMVCVVFAYANEDEIKGLMEFLKLKFPEITSLLYIENQKKNDTIFDQVAHLYDGRDHIFEEMHSTDEKSALKFKIGVKSFYQTNSAQAFELYKITKDFAELKPDYLVYDLYTGAGTIANFVARDVAKVVGVEYVPDAIEDAKFNSQINNISNTQFYAGDMKDLLTKDFINVHGIPDVVITDPPRAGMHTDVVNRLLEMESQTIVYVSCNAATQARDLALLQEKYEVTKIMPVDMFPHTQHVENVVQLKLRK